MDDLDRRLITVLRTDGRAPLSKLSDVLGVSRGTVQNRLDKLLDSGVILGFTVRIRVQEDTLPVRAMMMVEVAGKATNVVIKALRSIPEIRSLHTTNGSWDLIAEIHTDSLSEFDRVLREVRLTDGITRTETNLLLTAL